MPPFCIMENVQADPVVWFGGEVKALDDTGRIGGYLVRFSTDKDPDLAGDFFTAKTNFGPQKSSPILYHHGLDKSLKSRIIGDGTLKIDNAGVWLEGQLALRDEYEEAVFNMAKQGKLGWSSGTAGHLVEREAVGKSWWIKSWPLGLDASLTPTPCEPRTSAIPLKSYLDSLQATETESAEEPAGSVAPVEAPAGEVSQHTETIQPKTTKMENNTQPNETKGAEPAAFGMDSKVAITVQEYIKFQQLQAAGVPAQSVVPAAPEREVKAGFDTSGAPAFNSKTGLGDSYMKAMGHYMRTADDGGLKGYQVKGSSQIEAWEGVPHNAISIKASNDTDMNVGTAADGGNAVPVGHFQQIIARRDEADITSAIGVRRIPGKGTTVNVPLDGEDDGEFISTNEAAANDRDAPALGKKAMTLVKYTKKIQLSDELMTDEDSQLMMFLSDFVGRAAAKTRNQLLITEVLANGTNFLTFAGAAAIADGEVEKIEDDDELGAYLDDTSSVGWIMRNSTLGAIRRIGASGPRPYQTVSSEGQGIKANRSLIGYPVFRSNKVGAIATGVKSVCFGNFYYVGVRDEPEFRVLRDPYSNAANGQVNLHYYMRTVFGVLQAEAVGYATQA